MSTPKCCAWRVERCGLEDGHSGSHGLPPGFDALAAEYRRGLEDAAKVADRAFAAGPCAEVALEFAKIIAESIRALATESPHA